MAEGAEPRCKGGNGQREGCWSPGRGLESRTEDCRPGRTFEATLVGETRAQDVPREAQAPNYLMTCQKGGEVT